jgi:hypothetical protein
VNLYELVLYVVKNTKINYKVGLKNSAPLQILNI